MRKEVNVVWLEDELEEIYKDNLRTVKRAVESKGYVLVNNECETIEEAKEILKDKSKRIDFFISDFNLGEEEGGTIGNGLEYLEEVRNEKKYKQFFILYSKNYSEMKEKLLTIISKDKLDLINNMMIIDMSSPSEQQIERCFAKAVELSLSKWDELNALRGEYMSENAEIEYYLKKYIGEGQEDRRNYKKLYSVFKNKYLSNRDRANNRELLNNWYNMIEKRNSLAHAKEEYIHDEGFAILGIENKNIKILEENIDKERVHLLNLKEKIIKLIKSRTKKIGH